ncbi:retrovirus-related pol polyprotein from transposon TNT 1-94 [Tanacetum coccineum]|uniref:Retrovirus-related pol polyprotein from transposon TNT 1-94 n=1 Tax=Tanacetum coccineum TaxID=301880 RepID=A0ABQ4XRM0_9ASTR
MKCYSDDPLVIPIDGLHIGAKLQIVEEHVEIIDREVKRLKQSRFPIVKVRWNSRRGPEFIWEREDRFQKKYPHFFTNRATSSNATSLSLEDKAHLTGGDYNTPYFKSELGLGQNWAKLFKISFSPLNSILIDPKPKNVNEALGDESWIIAMQEELNQFVSNDVWELVPQPRNMTIIGTKWVFRNKLDENGIVSRNKARLVAQGYIPNNDEDDYDENLFASVCLGLEYIRILLVMLVP